MGNERQGAGGLTPQSFRGRSGVNFPDATVAETQGSGAAEPPRIWTTDLSWEAPGQPWDVPGLLGLPWDVSQGGQAGERKCMDFLTGLASVLWRLCCGVWAVASVLRRLRGVYSE